MSEAQWTQAKRLEIYLPPSAGASEARITWDGEPLSDVTRLTFDMDPNNLVAVRMERLHHPPQLTDTGEIVVDVYLLQAAPPTVESIRPNFVPAGQSA